VHSVHVCDFWLSDRKIEQPMFSICARHLCYEGMFMRSLVQSERSLTVRNSTADWVGMATWCQMSTFTHFGRNWRLRATMAMSDSLPTGEPPTVPKESRLQAPFELV
jgi:hypothetical protein